MELNLQQKPYHTLVGFRKFKIIRGNDMDRRCNSCNGGAIIVINKSTGINHFDFLYVKVRFQEKENRSVYLAGN